MHMETTNPVEDAAGGQQTPGQHAASCKACTKTAANVAELFEARPAAAQLFDGREEMLARWVVVSSAEEVGRSQTVILEEGRDLLAVDHAGAEIIAVRKVLHNVDGTLPKLYWTSRRRTAQMALVLKILGRSAGRGEMEEKLGEGFCAETYEACQASRRGRHERA